MNIEEIIKNKNLKNKKIVIMTLGIPRLPIEKNTVRFIISENNDNFYKSLKFLDFKTKIIKEKNIDENKINIDFYFEKLFIKYLLKKNCDYFFIFLNSKFLTSINKIKITPLNYNEEFVIIENFSENKNFLEFTYNTFSEFLKKLQKFFSYFKNKKMKFLFFNLANIPKMIIPKERETLHKIQSRNEDISIYLEKSDIFSNLVEDNKELFIDF